MLQAQVYKLLMLFLLYVSDTFNSLGIDAVAFLDSTVETTPAFGEWLTECYTSSTCRAKTCLGGLASDPHCRERHYPETLGRLLSAVLLPAGQGSSRYRVVQCLSDMD